MPEKLSEKVATGIPGLDGMIEGGFERNSIIMVGGNAGSGKSTFAIQFLVNGANEGENGLYLTFEEEKGNVFKHMLRFGWDLKALEDAKKLKVLEYPPTDIDKFISGGAVVADIIEENNIKRIVVDSVTSLVLLQPNEYERREAFLKTMKMLRKWGCTTLLTTEARETVSGDLRARFGLEYLADGFIAIHTVRKRDVRDIALEVVKMRGIDHSRKMVPIKITDKGITVYPNQAVFSEKF